MKRIILFLYISLCAVLTFSQALPQKIKSLSLKTSEEKLSYFLGLADSLRILSNTPGVGIAIVHDHEIIYQGGVGLRDKEENLPVTENTLFAIGSNTKAFTGVLAAKLVKEGKMNWKDPIVKHLPNFKLKEEYVTRHVTVEDALIHMTGLGRHDDLWNGRDISRVEILEQLQYLDFHGSLRSEFQYNNLMYLVVGLAIENITGKSWGSLVEEEIFKPLGMKNSYTSYAEFIKHPQKSTGYSKSGRYPIPHKNIDNIGPAGSISSTPGDIAKWLEVFVNEGKQGEDVFLDQTQYDYLTGPKGMSYTEPCTISYYAIGWGGWNREGKKDLGHGGAIDGQEAFVSIMPEEGFGIFIMTNQNSNYKYLLGTYAKNIFVLDKYERDYAEEAKLRGDR